MKLQEKKKKKSCKKTVYKEPKDKKCLLTLDLKPEIIGKETFCRQRILSTNGNLCQT